MVEYFVRVEYYRLGEFYRFCEKHNIPFKSISTDMSSLMLHTAEMSYQDAIALKLSMQINIMEIENE